jgi:hypothetical protein
MKLNIVKVLLVTMILGTSAMPQRTTGAFLQNATSCFYHFYSNNFYFSLGASVYQLPDGSQAADLNFTVLDSTNGRSLDASGQVPLSMFAVQNNMFSINIPDLRQLGSIYYLSEHNFFGPIAVNITMTTTSWSREHVIVSTTERIPQPDGTTTMNKYGSKYIRTSAAVVGTAAGYLLPLTDPQGNSLTWLQKGNFKSHFVP